VIQPERHPREWHVVPHVEARPHPMQLRPAEPAIGRILEEVPVVVPGDEPRAHPADESDEPYQSDETGKTPGLPHGSCSVHARWLALQTTTYRGGDCRLQRAEARALPILARYRDGR